MNIGFYGHSNCAYRSQHSFLDIMANQLNATVVNNGVKQGSEERILFELKKTKNLDLAIIFHSEPGFTHLPKCDRDVDLTNISQRRMEYLMKQHEWDGEFLQNYNPVFKKQFGKLENFINTAQAFRDHFYHPDAMLNRFYGALMQIDRYLIDRNIPCIHVLEYNNAIPNWFKFGSGVVDYTVMHLCQKHKIERENFFVNVITQNGNVAVASRLTELVVTKVLGSRKIGGEA